MFDTNRQKIAFTMNFIVLVLEICALIICTNELDVSNLQYYTQDSNYFSLFACGVMFVETIRFQMGKIQCIPAWVKITKYMSVCCLSVTFIVVFFIMAPFSGPGGYTKMLLKGTAVFKHLLCPLLAFVTYVYFEADKEMEGKYVTYALIPTIIYAIVSIILNLTKVIHGPYPFLYVYEQPVVLSVIWAVIIMTAAYAIAFVIHKTANWVANRRK